MGQKALKQRRALAQAKKKGKQSTAGAVTDDEASALPVNHTVTPDALSETAIESDDDEVAGVTHSLKAKVSATSHLGAGGGAWFYWFNILSL
jgi:hypothetical protein